MPNHTFIATLTEYQLTTTNGLKWLAILKETGFEFVRTVDNSVYTGTDLLGNPDFSRSSHKNYIFALFRNIGNGAVEDPFTPPEAWLDIEGGVASAVDCIPETERPKLIETHREFNTAVWNRIGKPKWLTREEVIAAGAPVVLAGKRSMFPQQTEEKRKEAEERLRNSTDKVATASSFDPFDCDEEYECYDCEDNGCENCC